jgi:5-methylcytosine-specific restriction enzyme A
MSFYDTAHWKHRRRKQLQNHPLCCMCLAIGRTELATVVDHIVPHRGDKHLFVNGAVQSLCKRHHDSSKKQIEALGYHKAIGVDGWPLDPNHPFHKQKK